MYLQHHMVRIGPLMAAVVRKGGPGKDTALSDWEWDRFLKVGLSIPEASFAWLTDMKSWTGRTGRGHIELEMQSGYGKVADPVGCNQGISGRLTCSTDTSTEIGDLVKSTIIEDNRVDSG